MRGARSPDERARLVAALAGVLPVSNWLRDRLLEGVPDTARVRVMPNCLDLSALPPRPVWREPLVLFAGRLVADKGADLFVEAWGRAALPGWRAEMIGADRFRADSPETPFLRDLRPRAARAGISLLGYRPHAEVLAAMARAAVVVVPSRWQEPFGLTALEAMASGAALIYASRGGLPEVAGDAGLVFDPDEPAKLAEALRCLAGDPERLAGLGARGRARARMFDLPEAGMRLDAYRQEVLQG
jgi:glycosyltransferase involved in cell wall biosynthesis